MAKDAYYFSHDSNAKDDPKCVLLIEQLGAEGYGIFWILIETLRDQPDYKYPLMLIPAISRRYNTTAEKMKTVIMQYNLFEIENDEFFYSDSLNRRMEHLEHRREIAVRAGKESAKKRLLLNGSSTDVQPTLNECSTSKVKESKVNKSKVKESKGDIGDESPTHTKFIPPTVEEIKVYCLERKNSVDAERFLDFYSAKGWMIGKNKVKDWKACIRTWERGDNNGRSANSNGNNVSCSGKREEKTPQYGKVY